MTHKMVMRNQSVVKYLLINMYDTEILSQREKTNLITKYAAIFGFDTEAEAVDQINTIILEHYGSFKYRKIIFDRKQKCP